MGPATLRRQAGFTLIEMLVVIGIMLLLMGLSIGAMNSRKTDKLLASEQLIADLVRQGRHTARTSGAPVILRLDRTERTIAGVIRTPSWGTTFDGAPAATESADPDEIPPSNGNVDGYAGKGLLIGSTSDPITANNKVSKRNRIGLPSTVGFYLSCAVRPPIDMGRRLPLLSISADGTLENSLCGMWLVPVNPLTQDYSALPQDPNNPAGSSPSFSVQQLELQGWLDDGNPDPIVVSNLSRLTRPVDLDDETSESHLATVIPGTTLNPLDGWDFAQPITGGKWLQVGLLYDGRQLILFLNGRRVGTTTISTTIQSSTDEYIWVGSIESGGTDMIALNTVFDNIRVERLARSKVTTLPPGVALANDTTILCLPDGRIEVNGSAGNNQITVSDTSSQRKSVITVTADGSVTSKITDGTP